MCRQCVTHFTEPFPVILAAIQALPITIYTSNCAVCQYTGEADAVTPGMSGAGPVELLLAAC